MVGKQKSLKTFNLVKFVDNKRGAIMGLPLFLSFVSLAFAIISWLIPFFIKKKKYKDLFDSLVGLFIGMGLAMWIMAVAFKDPVTDYISRDAQLIVAGLGFAGASWKYYFDPMKKRIHTLEVGMAEVRTNVFNIRNDVHIIKEDVIKKKK